MDFFSLRKRAAPQTVGFEISAAGKLVPEELLPFLPQDRLLEMVGPSRSESAASGFVLDEVNPGSGDWYVRLMHLGFTARRLGTPIAWRPLMA